MITIDYNAIAWWFNISYSEAITVSTKISKWFIAEIMKEYNGKEVI